MPTAAERYVRLGLRLGRHVDGIVDSYTGPPEVAAEVEAAPPVEPRRLVADADKLLDDLEDGWLRDQVDALRTYAGVLAGDSLSYADEVEGCYGVRPAHTDEAVFAAAHERLGELLPGEGPLAARYERWKRSIRLPAERIEAAMAEVIAEARTWTRGLLELPAGEDVVLETVRDEPWWAYCEYLGGLRSRIAVNVDLPMSAVDLLVLAIHETYPGHHAERCSKDDRLVRGRGLVEESLAMVPTPQSLVSEGIAVVAPYLVLESESGATFAAVVNEAGVELDLAHALDVKRAAEPTRWVEVNAALMLHDAGASEAETRAYLERWGLDEPQVAAHIVRFITDPASRSYILTYNAGRDLCRGYVAGEPERFRWLLTEQVRVRELQAARDAGAALR